jgi:hypothetical protein
MSFYAVLIFGFSLGVLVGYMWRDRISRARRARYRAEQNARYLAEQNVRYLEEQKRDAQRADDADRAIATDLGVEHQTVGVDHQTVDIVRAKLEAGGEIPHHAEVTGKDGISQPRKKRAKVARKPKAPKATPS